MLTPHSQPADEDISLTEGEAAGLLLRSADVTQKVN